MRIRIKCKCGERVPVSSDEAGQILSCPHCQAQFRISAEKFVVLARAALSRKQQPPPDAAPSPAKRPAEPAPAKSKQPQTIPAVRRQAQAMSELGSFEQSAVPQPVELDLQPVPLDLDMPAASLAPIIAGSRNCPSCGRSLPPKAKLCTQCGIFLESGRSILTSDDGRLDTAYEVAEKTIWWMSWIMPFGMYPIASEAFGIRRPWVIRSIAVLTILISVWFTSLEWRNPPRVSEYKNLMLWCGSDEPSASHLYQMYQFSPFGDNLAFHARLEEMYEARQAAEAEAGTSIAKKSAEEMLREKMNRGEQVGFKDVAQIIAAARTLGYEAQDILKAHESLPPEQRCLGEFHVYQLLTNAFLHGGFFHLAGNLLFLMILGSRVNALIGQTWTAVLYPVLAIAGSIGHWLSSMGSEPRPALGASGAIMGLAGMYLVFFPVHNVHMAAWWRWGLIQGLRLSLKLFPMRGFWMVLFYIAFDVVFTVFGLEDGVAHWAHLGGFIAGVLIASLLLITRLVNARGGDIFSAVLGRRAWALIGRPRG